MKKKGNLYLPLQEKLYPAAPDLDQQTGKERKTKAETIKGINLKTICGYCGYNIHELSEVSQNL